MAHCLLRGGLSSLREATALILAHRREASLRDIPLEAARELIVVG